MPFVHNRKGQPFGNLRELNPDLNDTIFIDNDTILEERRYIHNHIRIRNNSTLEIRESVECYANVSITIDDESCLKVRGGTIKNAIIKPKNGSNVEISDSGSINIPPNQKYSIPLGARMKITSGRIM